MTEPTAVLAAEISANPEKLIAGFQKADQATGAWATAAARHMQTAQASFNGVDFTVVTSKAKAEQLKLIELQHQLDVARAAGETKTVAALTEEIALLSKVRQLRGAGLNQTDATSAARSALAGVATARAALQARQAASREAEEAAEAAAKRREKLTGNPGEAVAGAFSRVRLGVLEEGGARIPLFGASLEALGAAGLAAAAGLAVAAVAGEEAKKALEFSEEIEKTSKSLGVTTTQLQQFDYAASGTSVGVEAGREALQKFNEVFGRYSAGLAQGRTASAFKGLGFTPEGAREIGSTTEALEKALAAISKLQNPQQRAALAERLGLTAFLPVVAEGTEGIEKFITAMSQAQGAGAVISPDEIKRAAELNDHLEQVEHTVGIELKQAFIDLGPVILAAAQLAERLAHGIEATVAGFTGINHASRSVAAQAAGDALDKRSFIYNTGLAGKIDAKTGVASGGLLSGSYNAHQQHYNAATARVAAIDAEDKADATSARGGQALDLSTPKKPKKPKAAPADPVPGLLKEGEDDVDSDKKALDEAQAALTDNIKARADFQLKAIKDDNDKRQDDLDAQIDKIEATKGLTAATRATLEAQREQASDLSAAAAEAKSAKVQRDAGEAQDNADLTFAQQEQTYQDDILTARASTAKTAQERSALELQALRDEQNRILAARELKNGQAVTNGAMTQAQANQDITGLIASQGAQYDARQEQAKRANNPLYAYANPTEGAGEQIQTAEVQALQGFNDGLVEAITQSKNLGDVFHSVALGIASDLLKIAIQREITAPLASLLFSGGNSSGVPGASNIDPSAFAAIDAMKASSFVPSIVGAFASGSDSTPGGNTLYDEKGTEGYVPPGAQIIPNETLKGLASLTPDRLGSGGGTMNHNIKIDLTGANGDETIRQIAHQAAVAGTMQAISYSDSKLKGVQRASSRNLTRY